MLFAYYGHPVGQSRIVSDVYGAPVNMPAQAGVVMAEQLNRNWVDDKSKSFASRLTGAYDAQAGVLALTNDQIILELDQERPIIIGARTHAMVLTSIQYYATPFGPNIVAGGVFDPWPGVGPRGLQQDELIPAHLGGSLKFVASARVSDASTPGPSSNENGGSAGCTLGTKSTFDPILILLALIASLSLLGRIVVRDDS